MKRRFFRLGDTVALLIALFVILLAYFLFSPTGRERTDTVYIYADGTLYGTVTLRDMPTDAYTVVTERGEITLHFSDDGVSVTEAACPDHVCVRTGKIAYVGESIVCAPLGVCITFGEGLLDGVTG